MNGIVVNSLNNFMSNLLVDTKNDKIRDFLRYMDSKETYFSSDDNETEILNTKNIWAGYAYLVFMDKENKVELNEREKVFIDKYFGEYLLNTNTVGYESDLKSMYLKYRLSENFPFNHCVDEFYNPITPYWQQGVEEYRKTIEGFISLIYGEKIELEIVNQDTHPSIKVVYNEKNNKIRIAEYYFKEKYMDLLKSSKPEVSFDQIYEIATVIEHTKLERVKRNEISVKALIYTVEDYLYTKTTKETKTSKVYKELFENVIANMQIDIDAKNQAFVNLLRCTSFINEGEYNNTNNMLNSYMYNLMIDNNHESHLIKDANYIASDNITQESFAKLYSIYVNGLKAMPKTKLTNVTKFFVRNGNSLTVLDMLLILKEYDSKISKLKEDQVEERIKLTEEMRNVREVMTYIENSVVSYQIEEDLLKLVTKNWKSQVGKEELGESIINDCFENYSEYLEMKYRVNHMYSQLDNLAGSNSQSKIALIRMKKEVFSKMISKFDEIDLAIEAKKEELGENFVFEDAKRNVVISQPVEMNKIISIVQQLIGRGVLTSEDMINDSIINGTPIIRNLNPGFKKFVEELLASKGVKEFKKDKKRK